MLDVERDLELSIRRTVGGKKSVNEGDGRGKGGGRGGVPMVRFL